MKKFATAATVVTIIGLGLAAQPAHAQLGDLLPLRAKIGAYLPTGDAKDFAGGTHLAGEVDLGVPLLGGTYASLGYSQGSEDGRKLRVIPVTVYKMFRPPNPLGSITGTPYFGVGAGAYFLRVSDGLGSESKTVPGAFAFAGYQLPNPYFVEAKYRITGDVNGVNANGLQLMVGRTF